MTDLKGQIAEINLKIQSASRKTDFINKVFESGQKYQFVDEFPYWQANNDKASTDKPWGKTN